MEQTIQILISKFCDHIGIALAGYIDILLVVKTWEFCFHCIDIDKQLHPTIFYGMQMCKPEHKQQSDLFTTG